MQRWRLESRYDTPRDMQHFARPALVLPSSLLAYAPHATPFAQLVELGPIVPHWPALLDFETPEDAIGWSTDAGITQCGFYGERTFSRDWDQGAVK